MNKKVIAIFSIGIAITCAWLVPRAAKPPVDANPNDPPSPAAAPLIGDLKIAVGGTADGWKDESVKAGAVVTLSGSFKTENEHWANLVTVVSAAEIKRNVLEQRKKQKPFPGVSVEVLSRGFSGVKVEKVSRLRVNRSASGAVSFIGEIPVPEREGVYALKFVLHEHPLASRAIDYPRHFMAYRLLTVSRSG